MKQLMEEMKGKIHLVVKFAPYPYRDFGQPAARAALAAREQGAFWRMHEKLLENYRILEPKTVDRIISELHLDRSKFLADMESDKSRSRVEEDVALVARLGLYQTPTFYINGRPVVGEKSIETLRRIVTEELKTAGSVTR